ncbi:insulin-like growth factor-binding protein 7 [Amphiura filiformis]|uniref:insulin-like growth factor-binding protein 7 n=1 Tax=Amphiura filiformis TaxID=82378 RepID=UPI003B2100BC
MKSTLFLCSVYLVLGLCIAQRPWVPENCPEFYCDEVICTEVSTLNCIAEVVQDGCGCCSECAKVNGEPCGGEYWQLGKCGSEYICVGSTPMTEVNVFENEAGVCQCRDFGQRVCGNDNVLYASKCALNEASRQREMVGRTPIKMASDSGRCKYAPIINTPPKDTKVRAGQQVYLSCEVEGNPIPDVIWYRDGKKMPAYHNNVVVQVRGGPGKHRETSWVMIDTSEEDSGVYQCHASNKLGETSEDATLRITPLPDLPEDQRETLPDEQPANQL